MKENSFPKGDFVASLPLVNLWQKRSLIFHFSVMNIKLLYKGTYLGFVWAALEPLFMFILLYVVFTSIKATPRDDFAIYLITGIMLYHLFIRGTMSGLASLRDNRVVIQSLKVRKEIFPVVTTGSVFLLMFVTLTVFFGLMPVLDFVPSETIILLPVVMALFILLVLGVSYYLSILFAYVKDIQQIWTVFSYALLFVSPIFWYLEDTDGILLEIQKLNPLGQLIEIGHKIVFGQIPSIGEWAYTMIIIFGILFSGYAVFQKYQKRVAEII